jgi:hypothetical protein
MPARKVRVEVFDSEGNKYTVAFEGQITREKTLRLLDLVELLGGVPSSSNPENTQGLGNVGISKFDKTRVLVKNNFPVVWFSSREAQSMYEQEFKEPIGLSTVATYLARMTSKGLLMKNGVSKNLKYKIVSVVPEATLKR